jgi:hypothetical protein
VNEEAMQTSLPRRLFKLCGQSLCALTAALWVSSIGTAAERPPTLTEASIQQLKSDGDRLADQGDFLGALQKYTTAYMGVVSSIRGQEFTTPVEPSIFNREELGKEMRTMMEKEYSEEELALMDGSYKVFGFVSPTLDTAALVTDLLTEQVAGFYDPDKKRMVLIVEDGPTEQPSWLGKLFGAKATFDKEEQKTTLAHELTHALQDQLYDLKELQERVKEDDDMSLAFSALVEGDATLLMFVEMDSSQNVRDMDPEAVRITFNLMSWMLPLAGGESYRKAPPIFRDTLIFPYFQGMLFAVEAARRDGWEGVHRIYNNPPVSTEQILHPVKYFDAARLDMPQLVKLPDLDSMIPDGWKHLGGNVLGELQISILLKKVIGGRQAAEGWDGDRYEVFQSASGELAMVFVSIWDSPKDAEQFEDAYRKYREPKLSRRRGRQQPPVVDHSLPENQAFDEHLDSEQNADVPHPPQRLIDRRDSVVYVVEGFSSDVSVSLLERLIAETQFEEKRFPAKR